MSISLWGWGSPSITTLGWGARRELVPWLSADYVIKGTGTRIPRDEIAEVREVSERERPDIAPTRTPGEVPTRTPGEAPPRRKPDEVPARVAGAGEDETE